MDQANGHFREGGPHSPEVLPPGGYAPPVAVYGAPAPPPRRTKRNHWAMAPATYALVGINCLVFLAMVLSGVSITEPTVEQLLHWGANAGPYVLLGNEWWRLITAMFVHVGILHLATNMWCLWNLGLLGEPLLGPMGVVGVYLLTGFAGNVLSTAMHPGVPGGPQGVVGAGASGAIFGIAGVLIVLLKSPLLPIPPPELKKLRRSVINFALLNFVLGAGADLTHFSIQIDNMAHLGGFLSGLAIGIPMVPRIGAAPQLFKRRRLQAIAGMTFLLLLLAFGMRSFWLARVTP